MYMPSMKERLEALEARRDELDRVLAASPRQAPVHLHPRLGEIHRDKVANLQASLNVEGIQTEAAEILSGLIDRIVLSPTENDIRAELHGDLAEILALCNDGDDKIQRPGSDDPGRQLSMVAGVTKPPRIDPANNCDIALGGFKSRERSGHYHPTTAVVWV